MHRLIATFAAALGIGFGKVGQPLRVAVTGAAQSRFNAAELAKAAVLAMGGQGAGGSGDGGCRGGSRLQLPQARDRAGDAGAQVAPDVELP